VSRAFCRSADGLDLSSGSLASLATVLPLFFS
jgi:hypothetical protein